MDAEQWLGLTDYASKYRVSVSTLRRRIKNGQLTYRIEDGRYLIHDQASGSTNVVESRQDTEPDSHRSSISRERVVAEAAPLNREAEAKLDELRNGQSANATTGNDEAVLSSASRLLTELKRAYTNILQEKEEQIIQLKEEVSDLKTLVRVLEDDNDRLRRMYSQPPINN